MKKISVKLISVLSIALLLSGCGLTSMMSKFNTIQYTVTPSNLEVHGGEVDVNIEAVIPEKYFNKKAKVVITPILSGPIGANFFEKPLKSITLQGEEVSANGTTIGYATGGKVTYKDKVKWNGESIGYLKVKGDFSIGDKEAKELVLENIISQGYMITATRTANDEIPNIANHTYEKETILEETATIYFSVNQSNVRYSQKSSEDMKRLKEFAKLGYKTHSIEIMSYASPEGSLDINDKVSDNRSNSTFKYTKQLLRNLKVDGARDNNLYTQSSKGEDWNGFNNLVKTSKMQDKSKVLNIVRNQKDPQKREEAIRDMAEIYDALENDVLPKLRKATTTLRAYEPKKTDEEIFSLSSKNPIELDKKELLYAATLTEDKETKMKIYTTATTQFSNDYRGFNNIAALYLKNGDRSKAKNWLDKANAISSNEKAVLENYGIIASQEGNIDKAQTLYNQSNANEINQGILDIKQGDYKSAVNKLKGSGYNATLAKIMNGNNATTTNNSAKGHYLNAVSAARDGNKELAIQNLNKAFELDKKMKDIAKADIEFNGIYPTE